MRHEKWAYQKGFLKKGFTLLEMIVTVIVMGILASVAIPHYQYAMEKIKADEGMQILVALLGSQKRYFLENGIFADAPGILDVKIPTPSNFKSICHRSINPTDPIANVRRTSGKAPGGNYSLTIDEDGTIKCTGSATSCSKLGCNRGVGNDECN